MHKKLDPAQAVIQKFKGAANLSRLTGLRINTICSWATEGTGNGQIPQKHWKILKQCAEKLGFTLTAAQLNGDDPIN